MIGNRCRWLNSLTFQPLYPRCKNPWLLWNETGWVPVPICVLSIRNYFLSVPLVAHNSTDLYPAIWSMLTQLFELHLVCRHETSCYHLSHNLLLTRVWLCRFTNRVHVCRRLLISDNQGHNCISPSWVFSVESDTGTSLPLILFVPSVSFPTYVCSRFTHLPQMP